VALEDIQGLHNRMITAAGNVSPSNDPKQTPQHAIDHLLRGARKAAAADELGLTDEEAIALASRKNKKNRIAEREQQRRDQVAKFKQEQKTLGAEGIDTDMVDTDLLVEDLSDPRGLNQDELQTRIRGDRGITVDEISGELRPVSFAESKGQWVGEEHIYEEMADGKQRYVGREPIYDVDALRVAPKSVLTDALADINTAAQNQSGLSRLLGRIMGGRNQLQEGLPQAEAALMRHLESSAASDAGAVHDLILQDRARRSPLKEAYSDVKAQIEAEGLLRDNMTRTGLGRLERTGNIRQLGVAKRSDKPEDAKFLVEDPRTDYAELLMGPDYYRYVDPRTGTGIAPQGPAIPPHMLDNNPNNMGTSNELNAPAQSATDWVLARQPEFRHQPGSRTYGDYPQVDITLATTNLSQKLKEVGKNPAFAALAGVSQNVRSIDEYSKVVDYIVNKAAQEGIKLTPRGKDGEKLPPSANPGAAEVANMLFPTSGEEEKFANALIQLEVAKQRGLNLPQSEAYRSRTPLQGPELPGAAVPVFDAKELFNEGAMTTELAQIPKGSQIKVRGSGEERPAGRPADPRSLVKRSIVAELKQRGQKPYIGAERGNEVPTGRGVYQGRDEVATREERMRQLRDNIKKRSRGTKPMRRAEYSNEIQKLRDKQVRTYVALKRAEQAAEKRRSQQREVMSSLLPSEHRMRRRFS
jgi:hypothetical protein